MLLLVVINKVNLKFIKMQTHNKVLQKGRKKGAKAFMIIIN